MTKEDATALKVRGNQLFRDGDIERAANAFHRAVEVLREAPEERRRQLDLEVACLCNLAFAYIKLGFHDKAEEACDQVIRELPSCAKARYRRAQARHATGRSLEASSDLRYVAKAEPSNIEVTNLLQCIEAEIQANTHQERRAGMLSDEDKDSQCLGLGEKNGRDACGNAPCSGEEKQRCSRSTERLDSVNGASKTNSKHFDIIDSGRTIYEQEQTREQADESRGRQFPPYAHQSSFMVSGWLDSAERNNAEQTFTCKRKQSINGRRSTSSTGSCAIDVHGTAVQARDAVSHTDTPKAVYYTEGNGVKNDSKTNLCKTFAESDWALLETAEKASREAFRRLIRHGTTREPEAPRMRLPVRREVRRPAQIARCTTAPEEPQGGEAMQQTSAWASLVDQEKQLRKECRAKLCVRGGKKHRNRQKR